MSTFARVIVRQESPSPKPACGSRSNGPYDTPLHALAILLILVLSTAACAFPVIARRFPSLPIPRRFIFLSRHFGTGVLIATAFVHLLPTAFLSLTDPCLPAFWNEVYPQTAGLVAMLAVFLVVGVEQFFALRGARHEHSGTFEDEHKHEHKAGHRQGFSGHGNGHVPLQSVVTDTQYSKVAPAEEEDDVDDLNDLDPLTMSEENLRSPPDSGSQPAQEQAGLTTSDPQKLLLQCLLLEAGILFHSIFIGMALSVSTGAQFLVLLLAISFHQTFEGFALGARIANLIPVLFDARSPKPWLMCLAYGATTPIGQVLGLFLHRAYDPQSETGLLAVGITNAISSGLLLFAGLVQLVAEDFLADESYIALTGRRRIHANFAVLAGGILMALVGAFA